LFERDSVDGFGGGDDVFGLGVSVGLPGEHAEGVLFESVVVKSFSGVVVVDDPVGRFCRGAQLVLDVSEERVGLSAMPWGPSLGQGRSAGLVWRRAEIRCRVTPNNDAICSIV
jgi:hypothetical protein